MDEPPKLKRSFRQQMGSRKKPKSDDASKGAYSGFGQKMLNRMGWKEGEGLGAEKKGISEPISVKLRPSKSGVGSVAELSEQQKRAERQRRKERDGVSEESSEEGPSRRQKKSGTSTPSSVAPKKKKTVYNLDAISAAGIQVPPSLQSIVDAATGESKATSALSLRGADVPFQTSLELRLSREVGAFSEAVEAVQHDAQNIEVETTRLLAEYESLTTQVAELQELSVRLEKLRDEKEWPAVADGLKSLQAAYPRDLSREAVAIVGPLFAQAIADWDPVSHPLRELAEVLQSLRSIIDPAEHTPNRVSDREYLNRRTTPYQSMMLLWFKQFHTAIVNHLDPEGPLASSFISAIEAWEPLLPKFIRARIIKEVKRKISVSLQQWNPRKASKHSSRSPLPQWILEWLFIYPDVYSELKPKLRTLFQSWSLRKGVIPGLDLFKKAFPELDQLLLSALVPRLATHFGSEFELDPGSQNLDELVRCMSWSSVLSSKIIAELLHAEFFVAKFYPTLHAWLTYQGRDLNEIRVWLQWWRDWFPDQIKKIPIHESDFQEAWKLVNAALDLEGQDIETLALPATEPLAVPSPVTPQFSKSINAEQPRPARQEVEEATFKDMVESWCAEEGNLLLIPLRKADEKTGFPLFRITASATGKGGVVVYFKGDVIYAQNKKDKSVWEPIGLGEGLISRAEGK